MHHKIYTRFMALSLISALSFLVIGGVFLSRQAFAQTLPSTVHNKFRYELYLNNSITDDKTTWTPLRGTPDMSGCRPDLSASNFVEGMPWPADLKIHKFYMKACGAFFFRDSQKYDFFIESSGPIRVYIDDTLELDLWSEKFKGSQKFTVDIGSGWHKIKVKYIKTGGEILANLDWTPRPSPVYNAFYKEIFVNDNFSGAPVVATIENHITHNYMKASPFPAGSVYANKRDYFSIRWIGEFYFPLDATYKFFMSADDAATLYIDEKISASAGWGDVSEKIRLADGCVYNGKITEIYVPAGTREIRFDFSEVYLDARAVLKWWSAGDDSRFKLSDDEIPISYALDLSPAENEKNLMAAEKQDTGTIYNTAEDTIEAYSDAGFSTPLAFGSKVAPGSRVFLRYFKKANTQKALGAPALKITSDEDEHGLVLSMRPANPEKTVYTAFFITGVQTSPEKDSPQIRALAPGTVSIKAQGISETLLQFAVEGKWLPAFGKDSVIEGGSSPDIRVLNSGGETYAGHNAYLACVDEDNDRKLSVISYDRAAAFTKLTSGVKTSPAGGPSLFVFEQPGSENLVYAAFEDDDRAGGASVVRFVKGGMEYIGKPSFSSGPAKDLTLAVCDLGAPVPYISFKDISFGGRASMMSFENGKWQYVGTRGFSPDAAGDPVFSFLPTLRYQYPYAAFIENSQKDRVSVMRYNRDFWEYVGKPCFSSSNSSNVSLSCESGTAYVAYADGTLENRVSVMKYNGSEWEYLGEPGFSPPKAEHINIAVSEGTAYVLFSDGAARNKLTVMKFSSGRWKTVAPLETSGTVRGARLRISDCAIYAAFEETFNGKNSVKIFKYD